MKVDEVQCPAVAELGVSGSVILRVQVRKDGKIRRDAEQFKLAVDSINEIITAPTGG